jgi:hypothetical protein
MKPNILENIHAARVAHFADLAKQSAERADLARRAAAGDQEARAVLIGGRAIEPPKVTVTKD